MRTVSTFLAIAASLGLAACGGSSMPASPSRNPSAPVSAANGSFGVFVQTRAPDNVESGFARCLQGTGEASCFSGGSTAARTISFASAAIAANALASHTAGSAAADTTPLPGAPTNLTASVSRFGLQTQVFLSWTPPAGSGAEITNYLLQAGSSPGRSDLASFLTGVSGRFPFFSASVGGSGTFYVRVLAVTAAGAGGPSNEIAVTVGDAAVPGAPFALGVDIVGSTVTVRWLAPFSGGPPTTYIIQASSTRGGPPDLANFATGNTATSFTATGVAPGTYFVRVLAANTAGVGPPSSDVTLLVIGTPVCTTPPNQPTNLVAVVNGSTVTLGWSPSTGAAATSYMVEAGSMSGATDLASFDTGVATATTQATGVGRGTYFVRVRGKNACGTSGASNEVVVLVR